MEDTGLMIRCAKCGEMNRLPGVHCKKCGARLDFEAAEHRMMNMAQKPRRSSGAVAGKLGLAAILALVIAQILWPGQMARHTGDAGDARNYRGKCARLIDALNRGLPASEIMAEVEINTHLQELLAAQPEATGFAGYLKDIGAHLTAGQAEVFVAIGRGPLTFTGHFMTRPEEGGLVVTGARAGHLPLPGLAGRLYARTQIGLFRQLTSEARIIRSLNAAEVRDGAIELLVGGGD